MTRTRNYDVRSVALFQLSYRSKRISDCGFRIADLKTGKSNAVRIDFALRFESATRNSKSKFDMEHRTGFEPVSQRWQRRVLNQLDQRCGRSALGFVLCTLILGLNDACYRRRQSSKHKEQRSFLFLLVGEDRIELSPRVPRTRMLALHHTPKRRSRVSSPMSKVAFRS